MLRIQVSHKYLQLSAFNNHFVAECSTCLKIEAQCPPLCNERPLRINSVESFKKMPKESEIQTRRCTSVAISHSQGPYRGAHATSRLFEIRNTILSIHIYQASTYLHWRLILQCISVLYLLQGNLSSACIFGVVRITPGFTKHGNHHLSESCFCVIVWPFKHFKDVISKAASLVGRAHSFFVHC